jgi:hypothetical protein
MPAFPVKRTAESRAATRDAILVCLPGCAQRLTLPINIARAVSCGAFDFLQQGQLIHRKEVVA